MSDTLADVERAGLVPTANETERARQRYHGLTRIESVCVVEAGNASAVSDNLVAAVLGRDPVELAYWLRQLAAMTAAADERTAALAAAPGGAA